MRQAFAIPGRLPGVNEYTAANRKHWRAGGNMKSDSQETVGWCIKGAHLKPHKGAVRIHYTFFERPAKNGAMRDKSNIAGFAIKVIEDALQEHRIIQNDNWNYMEGYSCTFFRVSENPRIEVENEDV